MNEPQLSEEEIRQLQAELDRITVDDVLIQTVVTLLNVGARKGGLAGDDAPVNLDETKLAIDGARALLPLLEAEHGPQLAPVKEALSRLQMAYVQLSGGQPQEAAAPSEPEPPKPGEAGPAQKSGRLWVPGQ